MDNELPPDNPKRPIGMSIVLGWFAYSALYAVVKSIDLNTVLFATVISGATALVYFFFQFAVPATCFWALLRRRLWGAYLAIIWQALTVAVVLANYFWFLQYPAETVQAFTDVRTSHYEVPVTVGLVHGVLAFSVAFTVIVSALVIVYLLRKRAYLQR